MKKILLLIGCYVTVTLLSAQAKFEWAKKMGGVGEDIGRSITVDASRNVYTTGAYEGTVDFDPGAGTYNLTATDSNDIYISKLDASGNFLWAKSIGGDSSDMGISIVADASGYIYITGGFGGTVDFDPGAGIFNLTSSGGIDVFILKLDASGNFVWAKKMGGPSDDVSYSIKLNASNSVYTTGAFRDTVDFDPGDGTMNLFADSLSDIFISKLDASGNFVWAKGIGGIEDELGFSIAIDASGNAYTTGFFMGTVDFDPGADTFNLTPVFFDMFILKLDSSGNFVWAVNPGALNVGYSIALDALGNVYTAGLFFDISSSFNSNIVISKLDSSGNFLWMKAMGGTLDDIGFSMAVNANGEIYTTGYFSDTADFDPGAGTFNLASAGGFDVFISKLDSSGNFLWAKNSGGVKDDFSYSIAVDTANSVYTTGSFGGTVDFDPGAGAFNLSSSGASDIFVHKMVNCQPTSSTFYATVCNKYTWNGQTYDSSGNYRQSFTNSQGCDSMITLILTIKPSSLTELTESACKSYTLNNITYSSSGAYTQMFTNSIGCDSMLVLYLYITPVNIAVTQSGNTLTANASGAGYQWVKCPAFSIIPGATSRNYWATVKGDYAVIVTENGCKDTSDCYTVSDLGINDYLLSGKIQMSPNPTDGIVNISISNPDEFSVVEIYNNLGMLIYTRKLISEINAIDLSEQANGLYILKVMNGDQLITTQIIIKQ